MKLKKLSTIAGGLALLAVPASAQLISVSQGGFYSEFNPFQLTSGTFEDAYDYGLQTATFDTFFGQISFPIGAGFGGYEDLLNNTIHTFMVQDANDALAFFTIYKGSAGGAISLLSSSHELDFIVTDDPFDGYWDLPSPAGGPYGYATLHGWLLDGVSDGFVLGTFDATTQDWSLTQSFSSDNTLLAGISDDMILNYGNMSWKLFGGDGEIYNLDKGLAVTFAATPEPSTIAFIALGCLGTVAVLRRRKSKTA